MILLQPVWLLLAVPLGVFLWFVKPASRWIQILRVLIVLLILPAAAGLSIQLPSRWGTLVVVADRSRSMPSDAVKRQLECIELIQAAQPVASRFAVVSFGEQIAIEHPPQTGNFSDFTAEVGMHASNLTEAIHTALSLAPQDQSGRILLLTDGRWTGRDLIEAAPLAAAANIKIDYRLIERPAFNDMAVLRVEAPDSVSPNESFLIHIWVQSSLPREFSYALLRNKTVIASGSQAVPAGITRLSFRDTADRPGTITYRFHIPPDSQDPVPENNTARMFVGVRGEKPILCVSGSNQTEYADLLRSSGLDVVSCSAESLNWSLEELTNYTAVILEDLPAQKISTFAQENIADWVRITGAGLMMTGGRHSFGPGGYFRSPLEPILPVSMELRKEHRKFSLAIVLALDRSGSMSAPVPGGKTKMDLANLASAQVLDMLSGNDQFGLIAVDSSAHLIMDLMPWNEAVAQRNKILQIQSQGGGIFVFEALSNAASLLTKAEPVTRHIILFADAADSEEPGDYIELLEKCQQAQITVSVVGLGKDTDPDAGLLWNIAQRGNGRCFFTENPQELPRLFAQDTFVVARSSFLTDPIRVEWTAAMTGLSRQPFGQMPPLGGYNLCYIRPEASMAAVSADEYQAPIIAYWQAGAGRSLCYTGQVNGPYTGPAAGWDELGSFHASLARWAAGRIQNLREGMMLTQELHGGICRIDLHLDPQRHNPADLNLPVVRTLRALPGQASESNETPMKYIDPDTLRAEIPLSGPQTLLSTVYIEGLNPVVLSPVCLPYSPEYKPALRDTGPIALKQLARATGGRERISLPEIWDDLPKVPQYLSLTPWLLLIAIGLLLLEILERRTGILSACQWKSGYNRPFNLSLKSSHIPSKLVSIDSGTHKSSQSEKTLIKEAKEPGLSEALSRARRSAGARTEQRNK